MLTAVLEKRPPEPPTPSHLAPRSGPNLLPCPFCGSADLNVNGLRSDLELRFRAFDPVPAPPLGGWPAVEVVQVECLTCGCFGPTGFQLTDDGAQVVPGAGWNTRAEEAR